MRRRIVLVDSEVTPFGRHEGHSGIACAGGVAAELLHRNPALASRVDLIAAGAARMAQAEGLGNGLPQVIGARAGIASAAGVEVHAFCASANMAVRQAAIAIEAGYADVALVVGVEHTTSVQGRGPLVPEAAQPESSHGFSPPVFYGLCADRYMSETGATREALAQVSVDHRRHGASNPRARFQQEVSVDEVLASRMIADPLTLLQCCPAADGAGALLLAAADAAAPEAGERVELRGLGFSSADPWRAELTSFSEDVEAGRQAYERAGIGPEDVDVAEIHDAFSISSIIHVEDLGLAPRGEGWTAESTARRRAVINPSGGLLSRGHPLGATGIAQFDAVRRYLLASTEADGPRVGLVQEAGGLTALGQMLSECAVLTKERSRPSKGG